MVAIPTAQVGRTQLQVTRVGLGTAPLGGMYQPISLEQATATIDYAYHNGIRFFDTAPLYGAGLAEKYLGTALAKFPRDSYVLATKVGRLVTATGDVVFNFSREGILRSLEESLTRLKLDHVDILHIHDADNHYREALNEAFPTLAELRAQGVIKAIGAGMNQWQMLGDFARNADFDCFLLAGRYTLLEQTALDEFMPLCQAKGISLFMGGVFNSGILARGAQPGAKYNYEDAPAEVLERVRQLEAVCAEYKVPLNVAAVQFPLAHPATTALILGAEKAAEMTQNLENLQQPIPATFWEALRTAGLLHAAAPVPKANPFERY